MTDTQALIAALTLITTIGFLVGGHIIVRLLRRDEQDQ